MTRAELAWQMKENGWSLSEISQALGIASGHGVVQLLDEQYRQEAAFLTEDQRGLLMALEFSRLEKLVRANMPSAEMGDPKSTDIVLKAMAMEIKLAKLDTPDASTEKATVLVIGGQEESYIEKLKGLAS